MRQGEFDLLEAIRRRFDYESWQSRATVVPSLFVLNLDLRGDEVPGMTAERVRRLEPTKLVSVPAQTETGAISAMEKGPRVHVQSFWRDFKRSEIVVRSDLFECVSQSDAREKLIWLLGEFESPLIERSDGVGDVGFGSRQDGVLLFSRANLVYLLRNVGRRAVSVRPVALALDAHATSTPPNTKQRFHLPVSETKAKNLTEIVEVTLADGASDGSGVEVCRKLVASEGELSMDGKTIVYRGPRSGLSALALYERASAWPQNVAARAAKIRTVLDTP